MIRFCIWEILYRGLFIILIIVVIFFIDFVLIVLLGLLGMVSFSLCEIFGLIQGESGVDSFLVKVFVFDLDFEWWGFNQLVLEIVLYLYILLFKLIEVFVLLDLKEVFVDMKFFMVVLDLILL